MAKGNPRGSCNQVLGLCAHNVACDWLHMPQGQRKTTKSECEWSLPPSVSSPPTKRCHKGCVVFALWALSCSGPTNSGSESTPSTRSGDTAPNRSCFHLRRAKPECLLSENWACVCWNEMMTGGASPCRWGALQCFSNLSSGDRHICFSAVIRERHDTTCTHRTGGCYMASF